MGCVFRPKDRKIYWIRYHRDGKPHYESSGSKREKDAIEMLRKREGKIADGLPISPKVGKVTFADAAKDLLADFTTNKKKSLAVVTRRVEKHLAPFFGTRRLADITTMDVRAFVTHRQAQGVLHPKTKARVRDVSNAEINRELATLKRMFSLAIQAGVLFHKPHIAMLKEDNVRTGFFEPEQTASVLDHLPAEIRAVAEFGSITGWRIASEVLPLEWRQVDFDAAEVRLDAGTTKNGEGRVFPMTADLRALLEERQAEREKLTKAGHIVPWVFWRMVADGRGGDTSPRRIISFTKVWQAACKAAGCPGRLPHDFRRTAVRNLVRVGIPERVAMTMTGHKTRSVFERYNIVSGGDLKDAARRLDAARPARQSRLA
jgi:integrase